MSIFLPEIFENSRSITIYWNPVSVPIRKIFCKFIEEKAKTFWTFVDKFYSHYLTNKKNSTVFYTLLLRIDISKKIMYHKITTKDSSFILTNYQIWADWNGWIIPGILWNAGHFYLLRLTDLKWKILKELKKNHFKRNKFKNLKYAAK